jgi:hypothetical protein
MDRCPFSGAGRKTEALCACPGFERDQVPVTLSYSAQQVAKEVSCRHLVAVRDRWGFMPGCAHAGGLPVTRAEAAAIIERTRRRELRGERASDRELVGEHS